MDLRKIIKMHNLLDSKNLFLRRYRDRYNGTVFYGAIDLRERIVHLDDKRVLTSSECFLKLRPMDIWEK